MLKTITIDLRYQPLIDVPPPQTGDLYQRACAGDKVTINQWRNIWVDQYRAAKEHFGSLSDRSYGQLYGVCRHKPCIVIGSGPSLKDSIPALKDNVGRENPVTSISCLHNYGLLEDEGCHADYYLTLDSGEVIFDDVSEGRDKDAEYYWETTKDKVLIAYAASHPKLWEKWQGKIYLFNALIPDMELRKEKDGIERFTHYISSGGNAGGACLYTAKAVFGADPLLFVGIDQCFNYDDTFHSYRTKYDSVGNYVTWPDVYGIPRKTWQSYLNFKFWIDDRAMKIPGNYVNCSGGLLGAYQGGNLRHYKYQRLADALIPYQSTESLNLDKRGSNNETLERESFSVREYFKNPKYEHDVVFF